jgi:hypothetical protein
MGAVIAAQRSRDKRLLGTACQEPSMKIAPLVLFSTLMLACAGQPRPAEEPRIIDVSPGNNPVEFAVGVHNADTQLGEALFSVTLTWPDGTETLVFDRQALPGARDHVDGRHHPGANITVLVRAAVLPTRVTYQDHLVDRQQVIEITKPMRYQTAGFYVSPGGVGTIHRASTEPHDHNPWAIGSDD